MSGMIPSSGPVREITRETMGAAVQAAVVWPEVAVLEGLAAPVEARDGVVVVPSRSARRAATTPEFDTTLSLASDPARRTLHLRIGTRRPVEPVRIADKLLVEVDAAMRLAGFWLEQVPPPGPA